MQPRLPELDLGTTLYRIYTARNLEELWPDPDRRDAAVERILLTCYGVQHNNGLGGRHFGIDFDRHGL
jgi:hypothetical protein